MGMTERQGGSDVRSNTTRAVALNPSGSSGPWGEEYLITGHKWFFSAPMCDGHLVLAKTEERGPTCFFVPRWRPDGSKNAIHIQRLKDKVGNRSNSSSEVEFDNAWGVLIGQEGRGISTIIEMAAYTRLDCALSSAGFMRQALVQALHYTHNRHAFGLPLVEQPVMTGLLADMALESEAATWLAMDLAARFGSEDALDQAWRRIVTPAAKFWNCKRAVGYTGEAMEVFGGNGYVETGPMGRLFREAPVNSIWEGSGNVMCLDVLRALQREPDAAHALLTELHAAAQGEPRIAAAARELQALLATPAEQLEGLGRVLAQRLVLLAQACLLRQQAPAAVADAFVATRLADSGAGRVAGAIDTRGLDVAAVLARAFPG